MQSWTRVGLGPGSGCDFQIISGFFRADIQHVINTKNFCLFLKMLLLYFLFESVFLRHWKLFTPLFPHEINKFSTACFLLTFTFIEQHRITCRPIFAHYNVSSRNRAFNSLVGFGPDFNSGCRVRDGFRPKKKTPASNSDIA